MSEVLLNIIDKSLLSGIAFMALIFAIILFLFNRGNDKSKRILGFYMLLNFAYYSINFFYYTDNYTVVSKTYYIIIPIILLLQPFFYFYIKSLTSPDFKCSNKQIWHFLPAFLVLFMNLFLYSFLTSSEQIQLLSFGADSSNKILNYYLVLHRSGYHIFLSIQALLYFVVIVYTVYKHKKQMSLNFSNTEGINLNWLVTLLIIFLSISILHEILGNIDKVVFDINARISYNTFYLFIVSFMGIGGIIQKEIYSKSKVEKQISKQQKEAKKYKSSALDKESKAILIKKLEQYLSEQKPYLNNDLKLDDIAQALSTNRQYLSQIINENFNQNFYTLINNYRIEEVINMFKEHKHKQLSIMGVANSVGFNSKSTFNTLFKKYTSHTPSQFIKINEL